MKTAKTARAKTTKIVDKTPGYDAVTRRSKGRDAVTAETKSEDGLLPTVKRVNLIASQRDSFRNSTFSPATAQQLQVNVVGNVGGHLALTTDDEKFNTEAARRFQKWARHCEFTNGISLNELLQLVLIQLTHNGGDFIAVFDDGIICNSGKVKIYESDEIKPLVKKDWDKLVKSRQYRGCTQSNGIVYDKFGRIVGAFVGSNREAKEFTADECLQLRLETPGDFDSSNWIFVGQRWRVNQGRGVATSTHITNTLRDLEDTKQSEVQAGKLNSAVGILVKDSAATSMGGAGSDASAAFSGGQSAPAGLTEDEMADYQRSLAGAGQVLREGGSAVVRAAPGTDVSSFNTERPSTSTVEFIKTLEGACATVFGFGLTYVTLDPNTSFSAFRGAMVLARLSFEKLQKKLERDFLDWLAVRFFEWSGLAGGDSVDGHLFWSWPAMREIDEGSFQTALEKKFTNFEASLQSRHGTNWKSIVDQIEEEAKYCEDRGILHPCMRTVSGGQVAPATNTEKEAAK